MVSQATVTFNPLDPLGLFSQAQGTTGLSLPTWVFDPLGILSGQAQQQGQTGTVFPFIPKVVPPTNLSQCQQQQALDQVEASNFLLPSPADVPTYLINTVNQMAQAPETMISGGTQQASQGVVGVLSSVRQGLMSLVSAPEQQRQAMTAQFSSPFATPTAPCTVPGTQQQQQQQQSSASGTGLAPGETAGINWLGN